MMNDVVSMDGEDQYHHLALTRVVVNSIARTLRTSIVYARDNWVFSVELLDQEVYKIALLTQQDESTPFIWPSDCGHIQESICEKGVCGMTFFCEELYKKLCAHFQGRMVFPIEKESWLQVMMEAYKIDDGEAESLWMQMLQYVDRHEAGVLNPVLSNVLQLLIGKGDGKVVQTLMRNGLCLSNQLLFPHLFGNGVENIAYTSPLYVQSLLSVGTEVTVTMIENGTRYDENKSVSKKPAHIVIPYMTCHPKATELVHRMQFGIPDKYYFHFFFLFEECCLLVQALRERLQRSFAVGNFSSREGCECRQEDDRAVHESSDAFDGIATAIPGGRRRQGDRRCDSEYECWCLLGSGKRVVTDFPLRLRRIAKAAKVLKNWRATDDEETANKVKTIFQNVVTEMDAEERKMAKTERGTKDILAGWLSDWGIDKEGVMVRENLKIIPTTRLLEEKGAAEIQGDDFDDTASVFSVASYKPDNVCISCIFFLVLSRCLCLDRWLG